MSMHQITSDDAVKLLSLLDQLIEECEDEKTLRRGHKVSYNKGQSWEKTNRSEMLERARDTLYQVMQAPEAEDQPSRRTRIRSKADPD